MSIHNSESDNQLRPFSKVIGEWADAERTGKKPQPVSPEFIRALHDEKEVELRRMRRWTVTAITFMLATVIASGAMLWVQETRRIHLVGDLENMSGRISEIETLREQLVDKATTIRKELDQANTSLVAAQETVDRLEEEKTTLQKQVSTSREEYNSLLDRERQARASWAYAEGERDALSLQLTELMDRLNEIAVLNTEPLPDVAEKPSVIDLDPELRKAADEITLPEKEPAQSYGPTLSE